MTDCFAWAGVNLVLALHLSKPLVTQTIHPWAWHISVSLEEARVLEQSFSQEEHDLAPTYCSSLVATNIIAIAGDPDSVNLDLPDTIECEVLPQLEHAVMGKPRGFKQIAAGLRRLAEWRSFLDIYHNSPQSEQTEMLTHSGHGSVTALKLNTTQAKAVSPQCVRVMIRRITGSASLGKEQLDTAAVCKQCDHPAGSPESLERHSTRCANDGGQRHYMHAGLVVALIVITLLMSGVPKSSIVLEKKGLRPGNRTRPGDIVVPNFYGLGTGEASGH